MLLHRCFRGSDAVSWLLSSGEVQTSEEAEHLCYSMMVDGHFYDVRADFFTNKEALMHFNNSRLYSWPGTTSRRRSNEVSTTQCYCTPYTPAHCCFVYVLITY
jgi:Domain found in Dishevelled, Egl-10, and Pleckstrin (DEP)